MVCGVGHNEASTRRLWPPPVGLRGFRGVGSEGLFSGVRLAGKQEARSLSTSESVAWIVLRGVHRIRGDLKWSQTGCLCSIRLNSQLTPPWAKTYLGQSYLGPVLLVPVLLRPSLLRPKGFPGLLRPVLLQAYFGQFYLGQAYLGQANAGQALC